MLGGHVGELEDVVCAGADHVSDVVDAAGVADDGAEGVKTTTTDVELGGGGREFEVDCCEDEGHGDVGETDTVIISLLVYTWVG